MTEQELNNIKQLLSSPDSVNRELGIVLALSQGMSMKELVNRCYDDGWFPSNRDDKYNYFDIALGNYYIEDFTGAYREFASSYVKDDYYYNKEYLKIKNAIKHLIKLFLKDNYPELLNKIK